MSVVVGERNLQGYCWHLTVYKISCGRGALSLLPWSQQTDSTNKSLPRFHPWAWAHTRSSAQRPPFNSSSALRDVTVCRQYPLPHHFSALSHSLSQRPFHKPCSRLASASDIAPVKCLCTCWSLNASRMLLHAPCPYIAI